MLQLHGPALDEEAQRLAGWGAKLLSRGLRYAHRLDGSAHQRTYEDVQAMLERTPLTPRERDVVGRLLSGASTRQIAKSTGLTVATVNTYLKRIFAKLGVHSRVELVARITGTRGVIPSDPLPESPSTAARTPTATTE
ncbi:MAG: helix-turn-helix transcriptional regulator [Sandaracinaceae bacterium]